MRGIENHEVETWGEWKEPKLNNRYRALKVYWGILIDCEDEASEVYKIISGESQEK